MYVQDAENLVLADAEKTLKETSLEAEWF